MMRPPLSIRMLGHPAVVLPVMGLGLFGCYHFVQDVQVWPAAVVLGLTMAKVMHAHERVEAYRRWKRQWDSFDGQGPRSGAPRHKYPRTTLFLLALTGLIALGYAEGAPVAMGLAMLLGMPVLTFALIAKVWRWSRRNRKSPKPMAVTVCVTKPFMPVPDMNAA